MPTSSPRRCASRCAYSAHSSIVTPEIGTSGQTSVAPKRGCSPWCFDMSISSAALRTTRTAASITASGSPAKVITVRFVALPGSTSSRRTPSTVSTSAVT